MVELLCVLRTPGTWHFLCVVCVIDLAFLLMHLADLPTGDVITGGEMDDDDTRLRHVMKLQDQVR